MSPTVVSSDFPILCPSAGVKPPSLLVPRAPSLDGSHLSLHITPCPQHTQLTGTMHFLAMSLDLVSPFSNTASLPHAIYSASTHQLWFWSLLTSSSPAVRIQTCLSQGPHGCFQIWQRSDSHMAPVHGLLEGKAVVGPVRNYLLHMSLSGA